MLHAHGVWRTAPPLLAAPPPSEGRVEHDIEQVARLVGRAVVLQLLVAEPGDGVQAVAVEDVPPVQHAVVVAEQHLAGLHRHGDDVLLGHLVDVLQHLAGDEREVAKVDIGHANLGRAARPPLAQEARLVVQVAEPRRPAGGGVAVDRRLRVLHGLQPHRAPVRPPEHLQVHVELWRDAVRNHLLELAHRRLLLRRRQLVEHVEVEIRHRDADLPPHDLAEHLGVQIAEDRLAVRDEELASPAGGGLEADEGARLCRLLERALVVQPDVVLRERLLVDLLVQRVVF
mmetsp:Transcript_9131/g.27200  ORF Transcript_9131/g.27200 Transcript_9131/m.27200 type:complete len:286 (-) Transcript_9131:486-1343(-)